MPKYNYKCEDCEHEFFDLLKIEDRNKPTEEPCPNCGKEGTVYKCVASPLICDSYRIGVTKAPKDFREGVLGRMKKNIPGNNIKV